MGKAWNCKHKKWAVLGLGIQSLLKVTFLLNLFCFNTILAELAEWSIKENLELIIWVIFFLAYDIILKQIADCLVDKMNSKVNSEY